MGYEKEMSIFNKFIYNLARWVRVILFRKKVKAGHYVMIKYKNKKSIIPLSSWIKE